VHDSNQRARNILEERYNLEDALVVATILNTFINHAHIVKMANISQLVNVIAPIMTDEKGIFLQTIYHPLFLFANNSHGDALELFVDSPTYKTKKHDGVPFLDVSAAFAFIAYRQNAPALSGKLLGLSDEPPQEAVSDDELIASITPDEIACLAGCLKNSMICFAPRTVRRDIVPRTRSVTCAGRLKLP
jgi:hypothetical protein